MELAGLGLGHRSGGKVCLIARFKLGCCIVGGVDVGNMGLEVILPSVAFVSLQWGLLWPHQTSVLGRREGSKHAMNLNILE